jgi:uncharacterized protein (TIGR02246 family)
VRFSARGRWGQCGLQGAVIVSLFVGCRAGSAPATNDESIRHGVTAAIDSLFTALDSRQPERMLAAWAPGADVLHVSDTTVTRVDTLLPVLRPMWAARRKFKGTWSLHGLYLLGPHAAVATANVRFVPTDTLGTTTATQGVWTLVLVEHAGVWKIVNDHRTMAPVPLVQSDSTAYR